MAFIRFLLIAVTIWSLKAIEFVIVNRDGCSFAMSSSASDIELLKNVAEICNVSFPFSIKLLGKTFVSSQLTTNRTIAKIPGIIAVADDLAKIWGPGFRIPLQLLRPRPSADDRTVYVNLAQMFGGVDGNEQMEW